MFQPGKHVHEPAKPAMQPIEAVKKAVTGDKSDASKGPTSPVGKPADYPTAAARRRSSASSQGGVFSGLMGTKRGSVDYSQRKSSFDEMQKDSGFFGGLLGGGKK